MAFFPKAGSYVERTIRGRELRFYPVSVWNVWTGQLRAISGLMGAVAELVGLLLSKPGGEVVENSEEAMKDVQAAYFRRVTPPDPEAQQKWAALFSAALAKAWEEATKENVLETFCLLLLDSLRGQEEATLERAKELAGEMDLELLTELAVPFFESSLKGISGPVRLMLKRAVEKAVTKAKATMQQPATTSEPSEIT